MRENIQENQQKRTIFLTYFGPLKANYRFHLSFFKLQISFQITDFISSRINAGTYILCFFLTLICFFYMFATIHPYLSLLFSHFVFLFSLSFSYSCGHETHFSIYNV